MAKPKELNEEMNRMAWAILIFSFVMAVSSVAQAADYKIDLEGQQSYC